MIEEKFAYGSSMLHRADPKMKIISVTALAMILAVSPSFKVIYIGLALGTLLTLSARLQLFYVFKHLASVNVFIIFLWFVLPFTGGTEVTSHLGPLPVYANGVELAHRITIKANAITLLIIALLTTSPVQRLGRGLQQLGAPHKLTVLLLTSFRYLGVIHQEYLRLRRAANLRSFTPATNLHTYRTFSYLVGMTLVKSYERAKRVHNAMIMRGFNGTFPVLNVSVTRPGDYILAIVLVSFALFLTILSYLP